MGIVEQASEDGEGTAGAMQGTEGQTLLMLGEAAMTMQLETLGGGQGRQIRWGNTRDSVTTFTKTL